MKRVWDLGAGGKLDEEPWFGNFRRAECTECLQGKTGRTPSSTNDKRATRPLLNVSIDLWGPGSTRSRQGYLYFLTCYDDHSQYVYTIPLKSKDEAVAGLTKYANLVENQLERTIKVIRSDQGGEFSSTELRQWCERKGIEHCFTPTAAHNQNSRVERMHLTLMDDVRTLLVDSTLPKSFWVDALEYAVYNRNRTPNTTGSIPLEKFHPGAAIDYRHLRAFGSKCVYRVAKQDSKLDARGQLGIMIGYGMGTTSYTILTQDKRVIISRDVMFTSDPPYIPTNFDQTEDNQEETNDTNPDPIIKRTIEDEEDIEAQQQDDEDHLLPLPRRSNRLQGIQPEFMVPLEGAPEIAELSCGLEHALSAKELSNPQSYQEARNSGEWPKWKEAMDEEMGKMQKYDVWDAVPRSSQRTLSGKWVYTQKIDGETGKPSAYKARFVV